MDPSGPLSRVFAALVHRVSGGSSDGSNNPFSLRGAGLVGFGGLRPEPRPTPGVPGVALFETLADGCRAAALVFQFQEHSTIQIAYRSKDPLASAHATEVAPLGLDRAASRKRSGVSAVADGLWLPPMRLRASRRVSSAGVHRIGASWSHPPRVCRAKSDRLPPLNKFSTWSKADRQSSS